MNPKHVEKKSQCQQREEDLRCGNGQKTEHRKENQQGGSADTGKDVDAGAHIDFAGKIDQAR